MKIYKHRNFHQWAKSEGLTDGALKKAIKEMENGLFEANLGSGLYKKRVALLGKGKSGGFRVIYYHLNKTEKGIDMLLLSIFDKSERSTIKKDEAIKILISTLKEI